MMHQPHSLASLFGDVGATLATALVALSHWAEILNPIFSGITILVTLAWWFLRFRQWRKTGKIGD